MIERDVSAPLLFAHSRGFPVMYRQPPPPRFNHLVLESFAGRMHNTRSFCQRNRSNSQIIHDDCVGEYRRLWEEFWRDAEPRFDTLLLWDIPEEARALLPPGYAEILREGRLSVYRREPSR